METLKTRLKFYMDCAGLNPTSLSRKARLNVSAVRDIYRHSGTPHPRVNTFIRLCRALGIRPHRLSPDIAKLYSPRQIEILDKEDE